MPKRLLPVVLEAADVPPEKAANQATREERQRLAAALKRLTLTITGPRPLAEAIVTAGGVSLREIDPKTMRSRLVRGLYFAGEVVDIDGYTGGYNLQAAFSMGAAAGRWSAREATGKEGSEGGTDDDSAAD